MFFDKVFRAHKKMLVLSMAIFLMWGPSAVLEAQTEDVKYERTIKDNGLSDADFQRIKNFVRRSELYRGNITDDFYYDMEVSEFLDKTLKSSTSLKVNVNQSEKNGDRNSLISIKSGSGKGNKILQKGVNMWFYKPGTANALRISPAQRFLGGASYADVSATNYTMYYDPIAIEEVVLGKVNAEKITLQKIKNGASYETIKIYIEKDSKKPIKAEFFTRSKKLIKTMYFRKFKTIDNLNKNIVISTEWLIVDNINPANVTNLTIKDMGIEKLKPIAYTSEGLLSQ